jgi:hypothetical protein
MSQVERETGQESGRHLSDSEVHDNGPTRSIFDSSKEWWGLRGQLDLHHEEGRNKLIVSVDVVCVLKFDVARNIVDPILGTARVRVSVRWRSTERRTRKYRQHMARKGLLLKVPYACIWNSQGQHEH